MTRFAVLIVFAGLAWPQNAPQPEKPASAERPARVLVLDLGGRGFAFTTVRDGVMFDIDGTGEPIRTAWTQAGSENAFLALDVNGNGIFDSGRELVSDAWRKSDGTRVSTFVDTMVLLQGFRPGELPATLPPGLGAIDKDDEVFGRLRLWIDRNHDGRSDAPELQALGPAGINRILLAFKRRNERDAAGNLLFVDGTYFVNGPRDPADPTQSALRRAVLAVQFAR